MDKGNNTFKDFLSNNVPLPLARRGTYPLLLESLVAMDVTVPGKGLVALGQLATREVVEYVLRPWSETAGLSYLEAVHTGSLSIPPHPLSKGKNALFATFTTDAMALAYRGWCAREAGSDGGNSPPHQATPLAHVSTHSVLLADADPDGKAAALQGQPKAQQTPSLFYVVHDHGTLFGDVVGLIKEHYEGQMWGRMGAAAAAAYRDTTTMSYKHLQWYAEWQAPCYYWLDVLAMPQHITGFEEQPQKDIDSVMRASEAILLLGTPTWAEPTLTANLWCLYEILLASSLHRPCLYVGKGLHTALLHAPELLGTHASQFESGCLAQLAVHGLSHAETCCPADRDYVTAHIEFASGGVAGCVAAVQQVLREALARALFWGALLAASKGHPSGGWCTQALAEAAAKAEAEELLSPVVQFKQAFAAISGKAGGASMAHARRPLPAEGVTGIQSIQLTPDMTPRVMTAAGDAVRGHNSSAKGSHRGGVPGVTFELQSHADDGQARVVAAAQHVHPAARHVAMRIACVCSSCMALVHSPVRGDVEADGVDGGASLTRVARPPTPLAASQRAQHMHASAGMGGDTHSSGPCASGNGGAQPSRHAPQPNGRISLMCGSTIPIGALSGPPILGPGGSRGPSISGTVGTTNSMQLPGRQLAAPGALKLSMNERTPVPERALPAIGAGPGSGDRRSGGMGLGLPSSMHQQGSQRASDTGGIGAAHPGELAAQHLLLPSLSLTSRCGSDAGAANASPTAAMAQAMLSSSGTRGLAPSRSLLGRAPSLGRGDREESGRPDPLMHTASLTRGVHVVEGAARGVSDSGGTPRPSDEGSKRLSRTQIMRFEDQLEMLGGGSMSGPEYLSQLSSTSNGGAASVVWTHASPGASGTKRISLSSGTWAEEVSGGALAGGMPIPALMRSSSRPSAAGTTSLGRAAGVPPGGLASVVAATAPGGGTAGDREAVTSTYHPAAAAYAVVKGQEGWSMVSGDLVHAGTAVYNRVARAQREAEIAVSSGKEKPEQYAAASSVIASINEHKGSWKVQARYARLSQNGAGSASTAVAVAEGARRDMDDSW